MLKNVFSLFGFSKITLTDISFGDFMVYSSTFFLDG